MPLVETGEQGAIALAGTTTTTVQPAPLPRRIAASAVDAAAILAGHAVLAGLLLLFLEADRVPGVLGVAGSALTLAYLAAGWGLWGSSLGKWALGLRIVPVGGGRMTLWRGIARLAAYMVASFPAKLGLVAAVWDRQRRGWHDHLAGTVVVWAGGKPTAATGQETPQETPASPKLPPRARFWWALGALGAYLGIAVLFTWPLAAQWRTHIPGGSILGLSEDSYVFLWDYWWFAKALHNHQPVMFTHLIFWPAGVSLRFHTLLPLYGLFSMPLQGRLGLIPTYNLLVVGSLVTAAWATYGLAMMVTRRPAAAMLAGGLFAFSPYMMTHALGHPNLVAIEALPVVLWLLVRGIQSRRPAWGIGAGLALAVLGYADWYGFLFGGLLAALVTAWWLPRRGERGVALTTLAVTGVVGVVAVMPLLWPMLAEQAHSGYAARPMARNVSLAGDPALWLTPPFLGTALGSFGERVLARWRYLVSEHTVYLGIATLILAVIGWRRRRQDLRPWLTGAVGMLLLSLGPFLRLAGTERFPAALVLLAGGPPGNGFDLPLSSDLAGRLALGLLAGGGSLTSGEHVWLPFRWLWEWLPMLRTASVPVRMAQPALLCLAVMAAAGAAALWEGGRRGRALAAGLALVAVVEFLPLPYPTRQPVTPQFYRWLAGQQTAAVVETPLTDSLGVMQYWQTTHGKPLFAGHISRPPGEAFASVESNSLLRELVGRYGRPGDRLPLTAAVTGMAPAEVRARYGPAVRELAGHGVRYLVTHREMVTAADERAVGRVMRDLGMRVVWREGALTAYRLE